MTVLLLVVGVLLLSLRVNGVAGGRDTATRAGGAILLTLASAQFLMTLDSSVMNVSIATVAKDVGTTVTGIQTAITLYTLVMATLMITGGKIGSIIGRKRAFAMGCVVYGAGSLTTAVAPVATGVRLLPLSITLLVAAVGIPRFFPDVSPRRVVRIGFLALFAGIVVMVAALDAGAGPEIVTWPMLLAGLGVGALASQLGSVTVSSVPDEESGEVGGLQNTLTNLGASIGTALAGAILISTPHVVAADRHRGRPPRPGRPLEHGVGRAEQWRALRVRCRPRGRAPARGRSPRRRRRGRRRERRRRLAGLRAALSVLAAFALLALCFTRRIPTVQPAAQVGAPSG